VGYTPKLVEYIWFYFVLVHYNPFFSWSWN